MVHTMIVVGAITVVSVLGFIVYNAMMMQREIHWLYSEKDRVMTERDQLLYDLHATEERDNDRPNVGVFDYEQFLVYRGTTDEEQERIRGGRN